MVTANLGLFQTVVLWKLCVICAVKSLKKFKYDMTGFRICLRNEEVIEVIKGFEL